MNIRPFDRDSEADYEGSVALFNRIEPDHLVSVRLLRHWFKPKPAHIKDGIYILQENGETLGHADFHQRTSEYHPQRFVFRVSVEEKDHGNGYRTALFDHILAEMKAGDAREVRAHIREDFASDMQFFSDRGFVESLRDFESRLDVTTINLDEWAGYDERMVEHGITFKTLAELKETDPDCFRKLHALIEAIKADAPSEHEATPVKFETWYENFIGAPDLLFDAFFVALHGEDYIGVSQLWRAENADTFGQGWTGVHSDWRRRSVATALKLETVRYTRANGRKILKTWNNSENVGMLDINNRMGFVRQPAWVTLLLKLGEIDK